MPNADDEARLPRSPEAESHQRGRGPATPREREDRWQLLFERNPLPMWIFDTETLRFLAVNDAAVEHYGWAPDEFAAMTIKDIRPPEDLPALMDDLAEGHTALRGGQVWRHRKKSGDIIHVDITAHSVPFDGRPGRLVLAHDISGRVHAAQALRASEARWERLFAASATGIASAGLDGAFVSVNPALCALVGRSEAQVLGAQVLGFTHPDDLPACQLELQRLAAGEIDSFTIDKRYLRPDGRAVWARAAVTLTQADTRGEMRAEGGARQFVAVVQDIDAERRAQQALAASEERFRNVARVTADAVWDWDLLAGTLWWNEGVQTLFGHDRSALEPGPESWTRRVHPDDRAAVRASFDAAVAGRDERWSAEYRFARADSSYASVLDRALLMRDEDGRALRVLGGMSDLTAQRLAEQRLRQQAALLDAARDAIVVRDLDDRITYWSRGAERLFGFSAEAAVGQSVPVLLHEDPAVSDAARADVLARGEWVGVIPCRHQGGRAVMVDVRLTLLRDPAGQPEAVLAIKTDVTERVAMEARLQQAQRLEAVGQLTGGVAHDFNNLLTVIQGNAELLAEQLADNPRLLPLAQMASTAAQRGAELTQRLLAFARKQPLQPQSVDAHQLLVGMDALLRRTLPEDIELELVRAAGLWPLLADPVQLESAVLNLVLNARDAMPQGGKITLETANAWIDQHYAERHAEVTAGQYVLVSVSDTGTGMTATALERAFEPFFTTKGVGKGTGLGLSMVYGFAKQSRGHVKLYSEPGHGTTARLYLPRADSPSVTEASTPRQDGDLRGCATVLVVEDDDLVRRFATDLLRSLGYQVLVAENGAAALAVLQERSDVELLFTDVVMPGGLNGRQLADAALVLHPALKVLFTSGYTENAIVHHGRLDRGVHLLAKPYRAVDLARKLRAMLG